MQESQPGLAPISQTTSFPLVDTDKLVYVPEKTFLPYDHTKEIFTVYDLLLAIDNLINNPKSNEDLKRAIHELRRIKRFDVKGFNFIFETIYYKFLVTCVNPDKNTAENNLDEVFDFGLKFLGEILDEELDCLDNYSEEIFSFILKFFHYDQNPQVKELSRQVLGQYLSETSSGVISTALTSMLETDDQELFQFWVGRAQDFLKNTDQCHLINGFFWNVIFKNIQDSLDFGFEQNTLNNEHVVTIRNFFHRLKEIIGAEQFQEFIKQSKITKCDFLPA